MHFEKKINPISLSPKLLNTDVEEVQQELSQFAKCTEGKLLMESASSVVVVVGVLFFLPPFASVRPSSTSALRSFLRVPLPPSLRTDGHKFQFPSEDCLKTKSADPDVTRLVG